MTRLDQIRRQGVGAFSRSDTDWLLSRLDAVTAALKAVALYGSDDLPLWSWCDDDWTCEHDECIRGRKALEELDEPAPAPGPDVPEEREGDVMPMTACPKCRRFYKVKKSGFYFEEGMPRGDTWQSYKLWVGDLYECEGCGAQVITGVGQHPLAEHYQRDYHDTVKRVGATVRIG